MSKSKSLMSLITSCESDPRQSIIETHKPSKRESSYTYFHTHKQYLRGCAGILQSRTRGSKEHVDVQVVRVRIRQHKVDHVIQRKRNVYIPSSQVCHIFYIFLSLNRSHCTQYSRPLNEETEEDIFQRIHQKSILHEDIHIKVSEAGTYIIFSSIPLNSSHQLNPFCL